MHNRGRTPNIRETPMTERLPSYFQGEDEGDTGTEITEEELKAFEQEVSKTCENHRRLSLSTALSKAEEKKGTVDELSGEEKGKKESVVVAFLTSICFCVLHPRGE